MIRAPTAMAVFTIRSLAPLLDSRVEEAVSKPSHRPVHICSMFDSRRRWRMINEIHRC
jgi:hypothetical protein